MTDALPGKLRTIWTVGHSNRSEVEFFELLATHEIRQIADVRRFAGSKRFPHFGKESLIASCSSRGIVYEHFADLGGRRGKPRPDSVNTAWRVEAFNAFADYLATDEFAAACERLIQLASVASTAMMCSEALPWQCHRRLISDALRVRGWTVCDIVGRGACKPHFLTPFARVEGIHLTYPATPLLDEDS